MQTGKSNNTIVVSALSARSSFGKLLRRVEIDTNIVVSAALKPYGLQRTVLLLAIAKPARLYVTEAIVAEYREVLARPELKIRKGLRQQLLQLIRSHAHSVMPARPLLV